LARQASKGAWPCSASSRRQDSARTCTERRVVEAGGRRGMLVGRKAEAPGTAPLDRRPAHRAGFAARIDDRAVEPERSQSPAGVADRHDLGMGTGIVVSRHAIDAFADDRAVAHHDGAERAAALRDVLDRQRDGASQGILVGHGRQSSAGNRRRPVVRGASAQAPREPSRRADRLSI
jgi:hypothetical protein